MAWALDADVHAEKTGLIRLREPGWLLPLYREIENRRDVHFPQINRFTATGSISIGRKG
jgi:hypothetical protein